MQESLDLFHIGSQTRAIQHILFLVSTESSSPLFLMLNQLLKLSLNENGFLR